ncbi:ATP synthase F0 subunit C [bacterium]|nr:ATP synthase F0 subunit C [bacterium]
MSVSSMLALSMALAAVGGSIAQSLVASKAVEGIARNPEAEGKIRSNLMLALAFIESLSIYVLVLAFMLK